ncbi:MAG: hypothetical protein KAV87_63150, partial [Desulfobacteraceae bacterium]|nr:hypothetical protein [Desulfobacteraceae bacterium]
TFVSVYSDYFRSVILQLVSHTKRPEKGRARKARNAGREVADHRFFDRESNSMVRQPISGVQLQRSQEAWHYFKVARIALPAFFVWETSCKIKCIRKAHFLFNPGRSLLPARPVLSASLKVRGCSTGLAISTASNLLFLIQPSLTRLQFDKNSQVTS